MLSTDDEEGGCYRPPPYQWTQFGSKYILVGAKVTSLVLCTHEWGPWEFYLSYWNISEFPLFSSPILDDKFHDALLMIWRFPLCSCNVQKTYPCDILGVQVPLWLLETLLPHGSRWRLFTTEKNTCLLQSDASVTSYPSMWCSICCRIMRFKCPVRQRSIYPLCLVYGKWCK